MDEYVGPAVAIHQLNLNFGFASSKVEVLKNLDLIIEAGTIYALLGSSGSGKTSLVRCIVGTFHPIKGTIEVYGQVPGSVKCKVPGSRVGYMPQDLVLIRDLNIREVLNYYGRLHHMRKCDIQRRITFLINLLDLPPADRQTMQLSEGQKRRVSFAVALLHEPPLLILDEPTVGVDPILRESIWNHLVDICQRDGTTVLITTHCIEEARQANKVGFMRDGRILTEDNPAVILSRYNLSTLNDVYLKLCKDDNIRQDGINTNNPKHKKPILSVSNGSYLPEETIAKPVQLKKTSISRDHFVPQSFDRIWTLVIKNFTQLRRSRL